MGSNGSVAAHLERVCAKAKQAAAAAESDPAIQARMRELAAEAMAAEAADRRRGREHSWRANGIPERLWPMLNASEAGEAGGPIETAALAAVGAFLAPKVAATVLVLAGGVGTGKTVAAAWGCAFHRGRIVKALDLVRAGMFPEDPGFWPELQRAGLLAIDDLGTEPLDAKGYGFAAISDLLDRRYDGGRKTLITTNLPQAAFRERYGTGAGLRLWDRIAEVGEWHDLAGESLRRAS